MEINKIDTLNKDSLASMIKLKNPDLKLKDITRVLDGLEDSMIEGLSSGQKIKFLKSFTLTPVVRKGRKHYNGIDKVNGGEGGYVQLSDRIHIKYKELQRIKEIETDIKTNTD